MLQSFLDSLKAIMRSSIRPSKPTAVTKEIYLRHP